MSGNPVLDLVFRPWSMNVLFAASRLRVFTLLATKAMTTAELVEILGAEPQLLTAVLDACAAMGLLHRTNGLYTNSHLSDAYLVEGRPLYVGDLMEVQAIEAAGWQTLYDAVAQKGNVVKEPLLEVGPRRFTLAMNNIAMQGEANALASTLDLSGCGTMADVGCGSGMYSVALCLRNPSLRATLLDREDVLDTTREIIQQHGIHDRVETRSADITADSYGQDLDVVLLSDVLYQDKATCLTILRSAHTALVKGGRLVIRGYYSDPGESQSLFGALFVVHLLLSDPNREPITVPLLRTWVKEAGFKDLNVFALTERSTCLIAVK